MYNKLFTSILDSSIWLEPIHVRIVWITLLAAMDKTGFARFGALQNLADRARVPLKRAEEAVEVLTSPDQRNPGQEHEGRRIERVDGGYLVLNSAKFRDIHDAEMEREANARRVQRWRERQKEKAERAAKLAEKGRTRAQISAEMDGDAKVFEREVNNGKTDQEAHDAVESRHAIMNGNGRGGSESDSQGGVGEP